MISVGVVRQVDELGHIALPSGLQDRLGIHLGDRR